MTDTTPRPTSLVVHQASRQLEIAFDDGRAFSLPFELLRVYSPSAEVQGHGPGQETLQTGKRDVDIVALQPVGHYGVQPQFSDGHESGIYTWALLYDLGAHKVERWTEYVAKLAAAGLDRDTPMIAANAPHCGSH